MPISYLSRLTQKLLRIIELVFINKLMLNYDHYIKIGVIILERSKKIKIGIGFATGRKGFQQVLKTCIYNWNESGLVENEMYSLNLFIAYDLTCLLYTSPSPRDGLLS